MKSVKIYKGLLLLFFLSHSFLAVANSLVDSPEFEVDDSLKSQKILYVELLQPFLFGKAGIGFSIKNQNREYLIYGAYIFNHGRIQETSFDEIYNLDEKSIQGFEIGTQIRFKFRSAMQKGSLAPYLKEADKIGSYYWGFWLDADRQTGASKSSWYESVSTWGVKAGGLLGWSRQFGKLWLDLGAGWGLGKQFVSYENLTNTFRSPKEDSLISAYKLNIKLGIKL